jgi:hypothetical protein
MSKLILISAFVLAASVSVQAGPSRGLVLASNDQPTAATGVETAKPAECQLAAQPTATETKAETSKPDASKSSKKTYARTWRDDEAKARRIAAKYGVYW